MPHFSGIYHARSGTPLPRVWRVERGERRQATA